MATLGPCLWGLEGAVKFSGSTYVPHNESEARRNAFKEVVIRDTCSTLKLGAAQPHCEAELRFAIDDLCTRGDVAITGAGS